MDPSALLYTQDLSIAFGGLVAVDKVNFQLTKGEVLGLIGPNGSGKTTIFNMLTGLYTPTGGNFFLDGESLLDKQSYEIARRGVARTFQISRLCLDLSLVDNVFIGMHSRQKSFLVDTLFRNDRLKKEVKESRERVIFLLSVFNKDLVNKLGVKAGSLPQIDRRRVEICRAMAMEPRLLLLDEPSAGMTPTEITELMEDIHKVQEAWQGISIIIVEHVMTVIRTITNRVVVLNFGKKIAEGSFEEVSHNPEVREAYLGKRG
jgi:branched-chain amino acid transport system ATP-binding protein